MTPTRAKLKYRENQMAVDLSKMSRKDLLKLRDDVAKELKTVEKRERQEALDAARKAAAKFGFSLDELAGGKGRKKRAKGRAPAEPKYQNPGNPEQTWSGLGRRPQWFNDAVAKGADPKELEI